MCQDLCLWEIEDVSTSCTFAFLPWRRKRCGLPEEDWRLLHRISFDLLRLDAAQLLKESGYTRFLESLTRSDRSLPVKLLSEAMRLMSLHLKLVNFNRLVFQAACQGSNDRVLQTYAAPASSRPALSTADAERVWSAYRSFLKQWVFSPIFLDLFTLPYKTPLSLPAARETVWSRFLDELSSLADIADSTWKPPVSFRLLKFWLSRVHEANHWPADEPYHRLCELSAACWEYDDPDSNRVHTYADYCGSMQAGQFIRQSAAELYFPVQGMTWPDPIEDSQHIDWLDRQVYDRMATCVAGAKGHPKGELLVRSCSESDELTHDEIVTLLRFLRSYSATHFMGHLGELIGLPLVIRTFQTQLPPTATCIPGSSIRIRTDRGWQQGPDAVIANVRFENATIEVEIIGLVEVKAYHRSAKKLKEQIAKHRRRWNQGEVKLLAEEPNTTARWLSWSSLKEHPNQREFTVTNSKWPDSIQEIGVVPAYRRQKKQSASNGLVIVPMPWRPQGFRSMGFHFSLWLIENFGRVDAPDDYERGPTAWHAILKNFLDSGSSSKRIDKSTAHSLLSVIESRAENADTFWAF